MSHPNLKAVFNQLKSDKTKDRQQGITLIREVFSRDAVVEKLDEDGDGRPWLAIFQALFTAVLNERSAATRKGGPVAAAERRLKDAASTVRWLTERSVTKWATKVAKPLVKHLLQTMVFSGRLFAPVALDYVKALRVICDYPPHRDHIMTKFDDWIPILSLSFAVVLGDDLKKSLEDIITEEGTSEAEVNSALSEDDETPARKRRRVESADADMKPSTSRLAAPRTASPEQIEFVALIATLLRSSRLRLVAAGHRQLAGAVLDRLSRFFKLYPVETSAHLDAIGAVQAALESIGLNARNDVIAFGVSIWDNLLQLWSTKMRSTKEGVLMVLKMIFPYVVHADASRFDKIEGFSRLLRLLQADNVSRWGFEELHTDALRLEVTVSHSEEPFVAHTFKAGFNFIAGQATAWANLELMADVVKELYLLSESNHSSSTENKRTRLENPIKAILHSIQLPKSARGKTYMLQSLIFVIERHWKSLHAEVQLETMDCLLHMITTDDSTIQSWIFCCFAAIAYADMDLARSSDHSKEKIASRWDAVWSHAMRRTNAPFVCRAACHAAHLLLLCAKLPTTRILSEIETMAQDINVQGPSAPYDSVCAFLGRCVKVANQDARLHRMHLDDKVLSWLIENWNILSGMSRSASSTTGLSQIRLEQFTIRDILGLLESACGFSELSQILCPIQLPQHPIVDLLQNQIDTATIREYLLDGQFAYARPSSSLNDMQLSKAKTRSAEHGIHLIQPDARMRKVSAFFLKTLESITPAWDEGAEVTLRPPAESVRRTLDFAILTICFESSLAMNGIANNRRSLVAACKLITLLAPQLVSLGWSIAELATLTSSFAPLSSDSLETRMNSKWEAFIDPGKATGVRRSSNKNHALNSTRSYKAPKRLLQATIWQSSDVQDALAAVLRSFKRILENLASDRGKTLDKHLAPARDDDKDGFGPIRTTAASALDVGHHEAEDQSATEMIVRVCLNNLALAPVLRSTEGHASRDKTLVELLSTCADVGKFQVLLPPFLEHVRQQNIRVTASDLDSLLTFIEEPLMSYEFSSSDSFHVTVIQLLDATTHAWLSNGFSPETGGKVKAVVSWLGDKWRVDGLCSWRARDALARFYDRYLSLDPLQQILADQSGEEKVRFENLPDELVAHMVKDEDIRVRFTAVLSCARLFSTMYIRAKDPMEVYNNIHLKLCLVLDDYEHMLTRFVCLANIMIASSAVRRGPYWHLLEACLHSHIYVKHIESVLSVAAEKMGLDRYSDLFESYASQIAYSICFAQQDFFRFPSHLLGYHDREECAGATFTSLSPTNLLVGLEKDGNLLQEHGPFVTHCLVLKKSPKDGLLECFSDVMGCYIVFFIDNSQELQSNRVDGDVSLVEIDGPTLSKDLETKFACFGSAEHLRQQIAYNVDAIICAILRTCGDLDYRKEGSIVKAFEGFNKNDRSIRAFRSLMQFRGQGEFDMHPPNFPKFSTEVIISALDWLNGQVETANSAASTYHVMHHFFATVARCPLINEQLRLLTCLCIWISLAYSHFKNTTLLRVLMTGAATILGEPDLSAMAQGMLDWAFIHLRETQSDSPHIVEILIRICTISREFTSSEDNVVRKTGMRLKEWIEAQVVSLGQVKTLRKRIAVSLAAWPIDLNDRLLAIRDDLGSVDLSSVLDDPYLSDNKFKIARRLSALTKESYYDKEQFAAHDFWRLKDCIPMTNMVPEEIDAFTSLLIANSGYIRTQAIDKAYGRSIGTRQLTLSMQKDVNWSKRPIIHALLDLLTDKSARIVHVAYRTLRQLAGKSQFASAEYGSWPPDYRGDVTFLDFCPVEVPNSTSQKISEIATPKFLEVASNFPRWISELAVFLASVLSASDPFYSRLIDVLNAIPEFAEQMFPVLVHTLLLDSRRTASATSSATIQRTLSDYLNKLLLHDEMDVRCHRSVIDLVLHLRHFNPGSSKDDLAYNRWLDLNFMLLSRSAIRCGAYTTALLFLELAVEYRQTQDDDGTSSEHILFDIYSHIDEPDGFYGIKTLDLQGFLLRRFQHEKQWDKAFQFHGAGFEANSGRLGNSGGIIKSLHSFGFNKLAMSTMQSMETGPSSSRSTDMEYRLGWRTEAWDLPDPVDDDTSGSTLYVALRAVHRERESDVIDNIVSKSLSDELQRLRDLGNENLIEIRQVTQNLMCLAQIKHWRGATIQRSLVANSIIETDIHWKEFCSIQRSFDFSDMENIIATRISLLRSARQREQREQIGSMQSDLSRTLFKMEKDCLLQLSEAAREANQTQIALNSILCARQLEEASRFDVQQEFANVLWLQREQKFAVDCLKAEIRHRKRILPNSNDGPEKVQEALALAKLGEWTSEACLEKPDYIHSNYFAPAIELLVGGREANRSLSNVQAAVFHKCALFAEQQYQALISSEEIRRLQIYQERKAQEIADRDEFLKKAKASAKPNSERVSELYQHQRKAKALSAQDTAQLEELTGARGNYLRQAVEMLSLCLKASDLYDVDSVIRMCSLWFANFKGSESVVQSTINDIPSFKFVFLAHQLSARLSASEASNTSNQKALQTLLMRMCSEHPFHSLYQVYSLQSTHGGSSDRRRSNVIASESSQADRATAALGLFDQLLSLPGPVSKTTRDVRQLCKAYLEWAKHPIKTDPSVNDRRRKKEKLLIPNTLTIRKIKDIHVPVTTINTPLDPSMRYKDCIWISYYQENYDTAGGINLPKICYCFGSDGIKYKQLFKGEGNDDLRQDAVMEQVFELCNQVLSQDQQTRKRELSIRSYKVIPLSSQAGLLEFVGNTKPLQFLNAAHDKYNKSDITPRQCNERLSSLRKEMGSDMATLKVALVNEFKEIRKKFRPVMRHFFSEHRKEPQAWFEMRLKYSRSVAVTSIVGHILGLGDRHLSNILIDTVTGEVVHIDLGIAFEQGQLLPIPERVPFRLTADMVDGFGMSGTDGVFRRCAEETLRVLRDGSSVIRTVLEVFKYDPLHSWTVSAVKIRKVQADTAASNQLESGTALGIDMNSGVEDESADRALSSVAKKLDKSLSVEHTVNELISEATDITNLAMMFVGWSPFC